MSDELELARVQAAEWKAAYEQVCAERDALYWRVLRCSEPELEGLRATVAAIREAALAARDPLVVRMCDEAMAGRYPERRAA
jgi:hypothetical protein